MGARFHGRFGHTSAIAMSNYEKPEQVALGLGDKVEVWCNGVLTGRLTDEEVVRLGSGRSADGRQQLRRRHPRLKEGEGLTFTVPFTVTAAMKERGLLNDPVTPFSFLNRNAVLAMRELNRYAYGRTTEPQKVIINGVPQVRRVTKRVKVDLIYLVYRGFRTRAGQVSPQISVFVLNTGRAADGKHYALDWKGLYDAQQQVKSIWHLGLAYELGTKAGIKCVPHDGAFRALGIDPRIKPERTKQIRKRMRKMRRGSNRVRNRRARDRAARDTRGPKPDVSWAEAVKNTFYQVRGRVERTVKQLSKARQRRFARQCVRAAVESCRDNSLRFSTRDVQTVAAHTALPHVSPAVFVRAFKHEMGRIEHLGIAKVRDFQTGEALFTGAAQEATERRAVQALAHGTQRSGGKLSPRQVARALSAKGHDARELARVQRLVGSGGVTIDTTGLTHKSSTLRAVADAYAGNGRAVYHINRSGEEGTRTPKEFVTAATRTSHRVSLWRGLRTRGSLMDKLTVAEHIRRANKGAVKRGSLVVADVKVTDAAELLQIAKVVRKSKGHLLLVGEGAKELAPLVTRQLQHNRGPRR